jgi:hypothetical protein
LKAAGYDRFTRWPAGFDATVHGAILGDKFNLSVRQQGESAGN